MTNRRGDPVDPFAGLPLGQTLSGNRENTAAQARQELLTAIGETPAEARQSADLAAMQRRLAEEAEAARQRSIREAEDARQRRAEAVAREEARRRLRREAEERAFDSDVAERNRRRAAERAAAAMGETQALRSDPVGVNERVRKLLGLEARVQRNLDAVQRALTDLTADLSRIRDELAEKTPAPTGNEEAPYRDGERRLHIEEET